MSVEVREQQSFDLWGRSDELAAWPLGPERLFQSMTLETELRENGLNYTQARQTPPIGGSNNNRDSWVEALVVQV